LRGCGHERSLRHARRIARRWRLQPLFVEARSLQVGPRARVLGYRETLFRGEATVLAPGTAVRDAAAIGYPQRFASLKLQCEA
jgi:hypothetical protein